MSEYILLTDHDICPVCRARRKFENGNCRNCGTKLFKNEINFKAYEADGFPRTWWLYVSGKGWVARDQIMVGFQAQKRFKEIKTPERNTKGAGIRAKEDRAKVREKIKERATRKIMVAKP